MFIIVLIITILGAIGFLKEKKEETGNGCIGPIIVAIFILALILTH